MDRKSELLELIPEDSHGIIRELVEEVVFLEKSLEELKKYPFIKVDPTNPLRQRNTPAAKLYKEYLQQYINCIKAIEAIIYKDKRLEGDVVEDSPLRRWLKSHE